MAYLKRQITKYEIYDTLLITLICVFSFIMGGEFKEETNNWVKILVGGIIALFVVIILAFREVILKKQEKYRKGLKGEQFMKKILEQLPKNMCYRSDIKLDHGNADFLVIGEQGLFCIENKNINGRITYNKDKQLCHNYLPFDKDYLKQTKRNSVQIKEIIKNKLNIDQYVQPVLVFSGLGVTLDLDEKIDDVYILGPKELENYFQKNNSSQLSKQDQDLVYNLFNR